ncbi:MAG: biotin carboxylase N-terminal domain-containing protein [Pseudomonadota bacterium]
MFDTLLIANRGEIACRVIATARAMGVRTVAVYSDVDEGSPHVTMADVAVNIGPSPAADSYLRGDKIIAAAMATGAEAIHPGYGFLSENAGFARAVADAGLIFVGPSPEAIAAMGLKDAAKATMQAHGVPTIPGGDDVSAVAQVGFPLLIKARAGGGGKGMRRVDRAEEFDEALAAAQREAEKAFGDPACLIEKLIEHPRHIEVQILADRHGKTLHLWERDCSLQRRHQKVIEEAPAPGVTPELRTAMGAAAIKAAEAVEYVGAGTVEFIVDAARGLTPDSFYFLEMNTRLQVEHPVTEAITGLDLVEWQLRVAAGEALPWSQWDIQADGWAVEARLYAENPNTGFLPAPGVVQTFDTPRAARTFQRAPLRIDAGVRSGDSVPPDYDPMIAKIIAHGPTRKDAFQRLDRALADTCLVAPASNLSFLRRLLMHRDVLAGQVDTNLTERELETLTGDTTPPEATWALAAWETLGLGDDRDSPEHARKDGWRPWGEAVHRVNLQSDKETRTASVRFPKGGAPLLVTIDDHTIHLKARRDGHEVHFSCNDTKETARITRSAEAIHIHHGGTLHRFTCPSNNAGDDPAHSTAGGDITAPMPGLISAVFVKPGDHVAAGDTLAILEAMKMEHPIKTPTSGEVCEVFVTAGETCAQGKQIVALGTEGHDGDQPPGP